MSEKLVSVIVPLYNSEQFIEKTLQSILSQTHNSLEIILVDDGSTDATYQICKVYILNNKHVHYYKKENGGVASARNYGIKKSSGEFIAFCDHDDTWIPEKLVLQLKFFDFDDVGLVYGREEGIKYTVKCFTELLQYNCIPASSVVVRRCCFDELGMFDERSEMSGVDDKHMWIRIATTYNIACIDIDLFKWGVTERNYSSKQGEMLKAELCCASDIINTYSNLLSREVCNMTYYNIYKHYANNYMFINDYVNAKECYKMSLRYKLDLKMLLYYLLMSLPQFTINMIKIIVKNIRLK